MFNAPNKRFKAADRYKTLVNARVKTMQNSYWGFQPNAHQLFTRNKMSRELGTLFNDKIVTILFDEIAKIKVVASDTSRYHQIKNFFAENDLPI